MREELWGLLPTTSPELLGARIRGARTASGMTQSALSGDRLTPGFVSKIEAGKRRPDAATLSYLASRLGVSVERLITGIDEPELLALQLDMDYAELALAGGELAKAEHLARRVLTSATEWETHGDLHFRARMSLALVLESQGRLDDAIMALEDLLHDIPADECWCAATISVALSRCYRESGDLGLAIESGEETLRQLKASGQEGLEQSIRLAVTVAGAYYLRGELGHATRLCRRAADAADKIGSAEAQGNALWNASLVEHEAGRTANAVKLSARALRLLESGDSNRSLARLRSQLGEYMLFLDDVDLDEAEAILDLAAREMDWSSASPIDIAGNHLAIARAKSMSGRSAEALALVDSILSGDFESSPALRAESLVMRAQLLEAMDRTGEAEAALCEAADTLGQASDDNHVAHIWFDLGDVFAARGDMISAGNAYRQAAKAAGCSRTPLRAPAALRSFAANR
jgi:tetratricopeptide (TPR) repeat protein